MMYTRSAPYYDLLYGFKDYGAASAELHAVIQRYNPHAQSLLDVACGTGRHLEHLRAWYDVEGLDINEELLATAGRRCPDVPLHHADMVDFSLPRSFDVVACLFSSVAYVKTPENLAATVASMARHLRPGGVLLLEPWFTRQNFWTGTITANFVDEPDIKIAWMYTSEIEDELAVLDMHYLVGTPQSVDHFTERHELGLFSHDQCCAAIEESELAVIHEPTGPFGRGLYIGCS